MSLPAVPMSSFDKLRTTLSKVEGSRSDWQEADGTPRYGRA
jgi:hypothetical protein